ncbi:DUF222 domain-containing protein [Propioniciclava soli]|uniref:DUF222 domain-containing protein n=1 Tax=Propioniciclava soli TaxID=2775081 RepID=UPI001E5E28A7|nr:DUF222 domain-containing protein [Propioniciclava soli]
MTWEAQTEGGPDPVDAGLDRLAAAAAAQRAAEVDQLRALLWLADHWEIDEPAALGARARVEGIERALPAGADGTAVVGEFLALEVGPLLGIRPADAAARIADAVNLRDRHPALWEAVQSGAMRVHQARRITTECANLDRAGAQWVDEQMAGAAAAGLPWPRATRLLKGLVVKADPAQAARRAQQERRHTHVWVGKLSDGHVSFGGRLRAADGLALDEALDIIGRDMLESTTPSATMPTTVEQARAAAVGVLARMFFGEPGTTPDAQPASAPQRRATLVVHVAAEALSEPDGVARIEGWGPSLVTHLPELFSGSHLTIRPVLDPAALAPVDSYEIPERLRFAARLRSPYDTFPHASAPARACDLDHTVPHRAGGPPGQTRLANLAPLGRTPHRGKTHGGWHVDALVPGTYLWTSPHHRQYLVTRSGTHRLPNAAPVAPPARSRARLDLRYPPQAVRLHLPGLGHAPPPR